MGKFQNVGAVIAGLVAGFAVNMAFITLNTKWLYPAPEGLDPNKTAQYQAYLDTLPATAFVVVMLAHLGQAFVGGWVAARLGNSRPVLLAMIIGVLSLAGGIWAMQMFKGPTFMYAELPLYLVLAWLAGRMVEKQRAGSATP